MHALFRSLLFAVLLVSGLGAPASKMRRAQQDPKYRVRYRADFQHLPDTNCTGGSLPRVQVFCFGGAIDVTGTSDAIVDCNETVQAVPGTEWKSITCGICDSIGRGCGLDNAQSSAVELRPNDINATSGNPQNVSGNRNLLDTDTVVDAGLFSSVFFECYGEELENTDSAMSYLAGENDVCSVSGFDLPGSLHLARLAVSCATGNQGRRAYVVDDRYTDCNAVSQIFSTDGSPGDEYGCASGGTCTADPCEVQFDDIVVNAAFSNLRDDCVVSDFELPESTPSRASSISTNSETEFHAAFGIFFSAPSNCTWDDAPSILLECPIGEVEVVGTKFLTTECSNVSGSEVLCVDRGLAFDQFGEVTYVSAGCRNH